MPTNEGQENPWTSISFPSRVATSQLKELRVMENWYEFKDFPVLKWCRHVVLPFLLLQNNVMFPCHIERNQSIADFHPNKFFFVKAHIDLKKYGSSNEVSLSKSLEEEETLDFCTLHCGPTFTSTMPSRPGTVGHLWIWQAFPKKS